MCHFYSQVVILSTQSQLPWYLTSQLGLCSAPILLTHFSAQIHTHTLDHTHIYTPTDSCEQTHAFIQSKAATRKTQQYVPSFISALLSLFVSQLCRCLSHGDMNTKFAEILFPVVWLEQRVLK